MDIVRKQPTVEGPAEWFTGRVWLDAIVQPKEPSRMIAAAVHFTPGARTAWHTHEGGQSLYVTQGQGRAQSRAANR